MRLELGNYEYMKLLMKSLNSDERNTLLLEVATEAVGTTTNSIRCPRCGHAKSFSVTIERDCVLYHCFRVKCGVHGRIGVNYNPVLQAVANPSLEPYIFKTEDVPNNLAGIIEEKYQIPRELLKANNVKYQSERNSLVFYCYDFQNREIGVMERWYTWHAPQKRSMFWKHSDEPKCYVPLTSKLTDTIVVVEDTLSALKASQYLPAMAIMGTHLSKPLVWETLEAGIKHIILYLDYDAYAKAINIYNTYNIYYNNMHIICNRDDPKDNVNLKEVLGVYIK